MPEAAINGTTIHYDVHGSGFPLVFVHGGFGGLGTGAGAQAQEPGIGVLLGDTGLGDDRREPQALGRHHGQ